MKKIPHVAFGNDEIEQAPTLGKSITCDRCGKRHKIEQLGTLAFYNCKGKSYLAGIGGKDIRKK
jgi:hypothetical protein